MHIANCLEDMEGSARGATLQRTFQRADLDGSAPYSLISGPTTSSPEQDSMLSFIVRRLLTSLLLVLLLVTAVFFVVCIAPGDPLDLLASEDWSAADREAIGRRYGLDRSLPEQYGIWLGNLVQGDAGTSLARHKPVADILSEALPVTLLLTTSSYALHLILAVSAALFMSAQRHRWSAGVLQGVGLFFYSMPSFWLGLILIMVFAGRLGWFPTAGMQSPDAEFMGPGPRFMDLLRHMVLPVSTLALGMFMGTARYLRNTLDDVLQQDYILAARARGVGSARLMLRHALPNAMLPLITLLGLHLPFLLGGAVVVEVVFGWPGMGTLTVDAIGQRDYPVIMMTTLVAGLAVVLGSLVADLLYMIADPRVRLAGRRES